MQETQETPNAATTGKRDPLFSSAATCCTDGLKVLDLFSGIGGFSLGLERAGMRTVAFCEIDPFCRKVLKKHWPDVPIFKDIREVKNVAADIVVGGYPCQPFSEAGERRGQEDDRHLWPEMLRVIRETRPTWVIAENVVGHVTLGLDKVLHDLEGEGYTTRPVIIPACAVDAPHRRDRVWILAYSESKRRNYGDDGQNIREADRKIDTPANKGRVVSKLEARRWAHEPGVARVGHGFSSRVDRNRAIGNAVIPEIPYLIGRAIAECG